ERSPEGESERRTERPEAHDAPSGASRRTHHTPPAHSPPKDELGAVDEADADDGDDDSGAELALEAVEVGLERGIGVQRAGGGCAGGAVADQDAAVEVECEAFDQSCAGADAGVDRRAVEG